MSSLPPATRRVPVISLAFALGSACTSSAPAATESESHGGLHDAGLVEDASQQLDASINERDSALEEERHDASDSAVIDAAGSSEPPQHPFAAPNGFATQHGDTCASDTSPLPGPGAATVSVQSLGLFAVCPSVLVASDAMPIAVCTQLGNQTPAIFLLDADSGATLAKRELTKGKLFGGVYPYLDHEDHLLVVDGAQQLFRIGHRKSAQGQWEFHVDQSLSLVQSVEAHCGASSCDGVVGLAPDYQGRIWFATDFGLVGIVEGLGSAPSVRTVALEDGERILNSISTSPYGTAILSDHAIYLFDTDGQGLPRRRFRAPYARGSARKPGQLSQGSGSSPTFFGPRTGAEYLAITDNAEPEMNLLVYRSDGSGEPICTFPVPAPAGDGSENSPIGSGRSVIIAGTYGYPYLALPEGQAASVPASAPLHGGMARIDVKEDESGCELVWLNGVRSAAVPKLSRADGFIYTIERKTAASDGSTGLLDGYAYTVIDANTGEVAFQQDLPGASDTMQLAGTLGLERTILQGTATGILKLMPE